MAMENGIAHCLISIAAAAIDHFQRIGRTRYDHLAVKIGTIVAVRALQPLMRVLMMNVGLADADVVDTELYMLPCVAVINVGGIVGIVNDRRLGWDWLFNLFQGGDYHCIAQLPGN